MVWSKQARDAAKRTREMKNKRKASLASSEQDVRERRDKKNAALGKQRNKEQAYRHPSGAWRGYKE